MRSITTEQNDRRLHAVFHRTSLLAGGSAHLLQPVSHAAPLTESAAGFVARMSALSQRTVWFVGTECLKHQHQMLQEKIKRRKRGGGGVWEVIPSTQSVVGGSSQQCDGV